MKKGLKLITAMIVTGMMTSSLVGCAAKTTTTKSTDPSKLKKTEVTFYEMGEAPKDLDAFYVQLDKLTLKDLNCTVRFKFSTWTDYATKYNLMLASGENVDMAYSADWMGYATNATKGAFEPVDGLVQKYAPTVYSSVPKTTWDALKIGGKSYGIPTQYAEFVQHGAMYREDLRLKYNLPVIKDLDTLEQYLSTVKEKEPTMSTPVYEASAFSELFVNTTKYDIFDTLGLSAGTVPLLVDATKPTVSVSTYDLPEYLTMAIRMKSWADKGFWSKSVLSSKESITANFESGKGAIWIGSLPMKAKVEAETTLKLHPDWKIGYFNFADMNGKVYPARANHNVNVVIKGSANTERALMFLDKVHSDKTYYDLIQYGVKDLNYNLVGEKLDYSKIDSATHAFDIAAWAMRNTPLMRAGVNDWAGYAVIDSTLNKVGKPDPFDGFVFDVTNITSENAAISQVITQYAIPFEAGLVTNPTAALQTLKQKMKDAGFDKYKSEIDKELKAFDATKK